LGIAAGDLDDNPAAADAAIVFVTTSADLSTPAADAIVESARRDAVTWVAYPKARQLGTDLNRDSLAALLSEKGIRPVRQIAIDDVWSALRFRPGR
jgi:phage-related baseplate assembly protein